MFVTFAGTKRKGHEDQLLSCAGSGYRSPGSLDRGDPSRWQWAETPDNNGSRGVFGTSNAFSCGPLVHPIRPVYNSVTVDVRTGRRITYPFSSRCAGGC